MHCEQRNLRCHRQPMSNAAVISMILLLASSTHAYVPSAIASLRRIQPVSGTVSRRGRNAYFQCRSATNDNGLQEEQNKIDDDTSDTSNNESKLDNLIPSTMIPSTNSFVTSNSAARFGPGSSRSRTGLSSSVLLPSQAEADQSSLPLFQSTLRSSRESPFSDASVGNNESSDGSWKERLLDVSNFASLLCVLDCTLLPLVSIAIPAISWGVGFIVGSGGASAAVPPALSAFLAYLPVLSHGIALYFVIPVGLLTTVINYFFGHREAKFSMTAFFGVALIYAANSSIGVGIPSIDAWLQSTGIAAGGVHDHAGHVHDVCGAVVGAATNMMAHTCPEGWAHRMTNTVGCAFLLGSNYASRKYMEEKKSGCAASALAEAWGGDSGGRQMVCPPGCGCERPSFGTKGSSSRRVGGEAFFQWERTSTGNERSSRGGGARLFTKLRR